MEGLINLYSNLEDPNFSNKPAPKKKQNSKISTQNKSQNQKKPAQKVTNRKSPPKQMDNFNPLSIFDQKKSSNDDNEETNIIVGKEDIKSKIDINKIENIIENLDDKKHKYKSVEELQNVLKNLSEKNNLNDEESKSFLVYCWITKNLSYFVSGGKPDNSPLGALQKRVTQCSGYSRLFKEVLKIFNIKSVLVHGSGRTYSLNPKPKEENHEWNAIKINGEYYLCEVTWGSGKVEGGKFIKSYNTFYFCTPPEQFIHTHLPSKELEKWQLLEKKISRNEFDNILYKDKFFYFYGFTNISPDNGIVKLNGQNNYDIKIENKSEVGNLRISCKVYLNQTLIENTSYIERFNNYFLVHLILNKKGRYNILLFTTSQSGTAYSNLILRQQCEVTNDSKENKSFPSMLNFPDDLHIIEPLFNNLTKNKEILFKFSSNNIEDMGIVVDKKCVHLTRDGNTFQGTYVIKGDEILVGKFTPDNPKSLKVMVKYNIKK